MLGRGRLLFVLVAAVFAASCGAPAHSAKTDAAASHRLPRTDVRTNVGEAAVAERGITPTTAPAGVIVSHRDADGVTLDLQAGSATFAPGSAVHLVLSVTNKTGRPIGYLADRETHFTLIDQATNVLWTDDHCRAADEASGTSPPGFTAIAPGAHASLDDYYPSHSATDATGCTATSAGHAYLTGGLTICLNLAADGTCRGASDERVQATPLAVTLG